VLNGLAYFIALFAVIFHFAASDFALLDQDWKRIFRTQIYWVLINIFIQGKGLIFRDL
jgi:hypothetical protein